MPGLKYKWAVGPAAQGFAPNINVVDEPFAGTLDDYVAGNIKTLSALVKYYRQIDKGPFATTKGLEGVKLVTEKGYSVAEAARSLDIGETLPRSWKQAFEKEGDQAFPGHGHLTAIEEELRQLRAENKRLQMERDILKKATAFFAREAL